MKEVKRMRLPYGSREVDQAWGDRRSEPGQAKDTAGADVASEPCRRERQPGPSLATAHPR